MTISVQPRVKLALGRRRRETAFHGRFGRWRIGDVERSESAAGGVVAGLEVARLAIENDRRATALAKHEMRTFAPGTTLVIFRVRSFRFVIPSLGRAIRQFRQGHVESRE